MLRLVRSALLSACFGAFASCLLIAQSPASPQNQPAAAQPTLPAAQPTQPETPQTAPSTDAATPAPADATTAPSAQATASASTPSPENGSPDKGKKKDDDKPIEASRVHNPILWQDPGDIASRDMYDGAGGEDGQPKPPFTFLSEDMNGTNPKFDARDANGTKWRVKLGSESRPEVVASRLLWAVGYYVDDDYLLHVASIRGLHMKRGRDHIHNGDEILDARFAHKPDHEHKTAIWEWKHNPFLGTREFNGLRVMMAVLNNWDLKDVNNAVYKDSKTGQQIFLVSDIGATFATNSLELSRKDDKGNVHSYVDSKFITHTTASTVDFATPGAPTGVLLKTGGLLTKDYLQRKGYDWIGDNIPRADARWIGSLLGQLSHQQLQDAFRAGNFPPHVADEYVTVLEARIRQLNAL